MKYYFLVNPNARSGRGRDVWTLLEPVLKKRRIDYEVHFSKQQGHVMELAAMITRPLEANKTCCITLVVVGGDGSLNEAIQGICNIEQVILGYIPAGSGNDFTRYYRIPCDPLMALERVLASEKTVNLDIGICHYSSMDRRFVVSTGIGFDAAVCHQVGLSNLKKLLNQIGLGKLSYLGIALAQLFGVKPVGAHVVLDGVEEYYKNTYFVAVMNQPYEGGGFFFCPQGRPDDGVLDVIIVNDISVWKILCVLPTAFAGKHTKFKGVTLKTCKSARITYDEIRPAHTDGEPITSDTTVMAELCPEKIRLIV